MVSISVFFPCYNEQANVGRTVEKALEVMGKLNADFEAIIVDDGSSDNTGRIADEIAGRDGRVKVVHHEANLGYGAALQSGFLRIGLGKDFIHLDVDTLLPSPRIWTY